MFFSHTWEAFTRGITQILRDFLHVSSASISRWYIEPCRPGTRWIPMDQLPRTSSWSPTWESVCCSASCVPARTNILVQPSSPQTIMPSMILLSKAVVFAMDMLTSVYQPAVSNTASRRLITWWAIMSKIIHNLQVHDTPPRESFCRICSVVKTYWDVVSCCSLKIASFCLHFYLLFCGEIGSRVVGVLFPPLPCYSAVHWYALLYLKATLKTGY